MTEATTSMNTITYANQILLEYVAYDDTVDEESLKDNFFINVFNNRLDALYTQDFILTEDLLVSIVIKFDDDDEYDLDEYNEYIGYEEYIWDFIMDRTPPPMFGDDDDDEITTVNVDISSVYELMLSAPTNEAAAAA